jgi:hypothetical protein
MILRWHVPYVATHKQPTHVAVQSMQSRPSRDQYSTGRHILHSLNQFAALELC